jgi:hypothetical protein
VASLENATDNDLGASAPERTTSVMHIYRMPTSCQSERKVGLSEAGRRLALLLKLRRGDASFIIVVKVPTLEERSANLNLVIEGEITMSPIAHRTMPFSLLAAA